MAAFMAFRNHLGVRRVSNFALVRNPPEFRVCGRDSKIAWPKAQRKSSNDACEFQTYRSYSLAKKHFMADVANKYPENVTGKFYVDNQCIDCDLCRETAPDNFKRNEDGGYSFVSKQPGSPDEEARCKEAKEGCPVEAIGDNGA
jgi:ferredoxin